MGGNSLRAASDLPMGAPSRTRNAASSTALFMGRLLTTSAEIRRASSTGTALAVRILNVRENRAVLRPRMSFPASGTNTSFHGGSHHAENPDRIKDYSKINRYHVQMLAYYIDKLKNTPDGDGTLLDHSLVMYGTNMGDSNQHLHYDVPHILVGGASGQLKGGRHLKYSGKPTHANLLVTLMDKLDVPVERIGGSTGKLPLDTLSGV